MKHICVIGSTTADTEVLSPHDDILYSLLSTGAWCLLNEVSLLSSDSFNFIRTHHAQSQSLVSLAAIGRFDCTASDAGSCRRNSYGNAIASGCNDAVHGKTVKAQRVGRGLDDLVGIDIGNGSVY